MKTTTNRTIRVSVDPNVHGLMWSEDEGDRHSAFSGGYGDYDTPDLDDWDERYEASQEQLREVQRAAFSAWQLAEIVDYTVDENEGGIITITGPADHPLLQAAT